LYRCRFYQSLHQSEGSPAHIGNAYCENNSHPLWHNGHALLSGIAGYSIFCAGVDYSDNDDLHLVEAITHPARFHPDFVRRRNADFSLLRLYRLLQAVVLCAVRQASG